MYVISRCLLGYNCKYNGGNNLCEDVVKFTQSHSYITICPETAGGLKAPREPAEQIYKEDGSFGVISRSGEDVSEAFVRGAETELKRLLKEASEKGETIEGAILKANSPSCGYGRIYDGSFSKKTVPGNGVFAELLSREGVEIITEQELIEKDIEKNND